MTWFLILVLIALALFLVLMYFNNRTNGALISGGRRRRYLLHVPDSYDPDRPSPLVVCFHGFVQWPAHQARLSGWNTLADREGFLVVYPRGTGFPLRWMAQPSRGDPRGPEREVAFFIDLLEHLCQSYDIDRSRVYVNGMSNGGGMCHLLGCEVGNRLAALGGVAGAYLYRRRTEQAGPPVPVIAFHGVDDPVVPYQGGWSRIRHHEIQFQPVEAWLGEWAQHNGCQPQPLIEQVTDRVTRISYQGCGPGADTILYQIEGAGHTWPGGGWLPRWLTGKINREISATHLMWEFFQHHHR